MNDPYTLELEQIAKEEKANTPFYITQYEQDDCSQAVSDLTQYIHHHYQNPGILKEFCQEYHFSEPYISRRFRSEMGSTITGYVQKVRMDQCCKLLAGSDIAITEIAQSVGYHDPKFFNQLFKRMIKMSPREYRKLERGIV